MRKIFLYIVILFTPVYLFGQKDTTLLKHHFSINPLNIVLFQQIGVTYEFRLGKIGFAVTPGYIYPNNKAYSNWFIAGPTNNGSLGYYSGWFIVPQVNLYLTKQKHYDRGGVLYLAFKFVYKHMQIDSTKTTAWSKEEEGHYSFYKMNDKVKIYGGFVDLCYRYFYKHFFIDLNFGPGFMSVNHFMTVYGYFNGFTPEHIFYVNPPGIDEYHEQHLTINFTFNLGFAF
jgi:hypothetical protein